MAGTLRFRNLAQKVLWEQELSGQLSDGRWENSRPYDHWEYWHRDVAVVVDPDNVGRDFYVRRDGYCFTERELLEVIGDRMEEYVRVATGDKSYGRKELVKDLRDIRAIIKLRCDATKPVPPQHAPRQAKLVVDGWPQEFTVYVDTVDDPNAVEVLEERDRKNALHRVQRAELDYEQAKAKAEAAALKLDRARVEAGMLPLR